MSEFSRRVYIGKNGEEFRLTCSTFRDVEYIHLRKYYQDMEGDYHPSKDGVALPMTINNTWFLFFALAELLSLAEVEDGTLNLGEVLYEYEQRNSTNISQECIERLLRREPEST